MKKREKIQSLLQSVEKEDRITNITVQGNVYADRGVLFEESEDEYFFIRDEGNEIYKVRVITLWLVRFITKIMYLILKNWINQI